MECLDANQVLDYLDGAASSAPAAVAHLASCGGCRELVAAMARGSGPGPGDDQAPGLVSPTAAPARVGRFVIEEVIGRGGMGVVFRAWDPELGRRVALKRVRGAGGDPAAAERARARLVREARALAQLAHPNVVAIHDVGVHDGDVYLAMEHVAGDTLQTWLDGAPRPSPADVQQALLAVGRGLAAAHAAGLVHRDVKPDNILVGRDGRVRLVDFGLVAPAGASSDAVAGEVAALAAGSPELTVTGAAVGTPAFMSPEQRAGKVADAASDQWSFAVTACLALAGARPELRGGVVELPPGLTAPVGAVLGRALALDPDARHRSMDALVRALEQSFAPRRRGRPLAVAAGFALVVAGATVAYAAWPARRAAVACAAAELDAVWSPAVAEVVTSRLRASEHPAALDVATRVTAALDRHAAGWTDARRELCRDDRGGRGRSDERAARGRCLDRARTRLAPIARVLPADALDRAAVDGALAAIAALEPPSGCDDGAALVVAESGAPTDAAAAARDARVIEAATLVSLGQNAEAATLAAAVVAEATAVGDARRAARARFQEATAIAMNGRLAEAEVAVRDAIAWAARAGDDATVAHGWVGLLVLLGELGRLDEARALVPVAETAVARAGDEPHRVLDLLEAHASVAGWTHDHAPAVARFDRVFAPAAAALGDDDVYVIEAALTCAELLLFVGRVDEAAALAARARASAARVVGEHHLISIDAERVTGLVLLEQRRPAEARAHLARVSAWADAVDPGHHYAYYGHYGVAASWRDEGQLERAAEELERARRAAIAGGGARDYRVSIALGSLGDVAWQRGDLAAAEAAWTEALSIRREREGPGFVTAHALSTLGGIRLARGKLAEARTLLDEAVAMYAVAVAGEVADPATVAFARVRLARALWPVDRARALDEARAATTVLAPALAAPPPSTPLTPPDVVTLHRWIREVCAAHDCTPR